MKKKHLYCLVSALLAGPCSTAAFAADQTDQTVYFNQKSLPSDTQGTFAASVSVAQSVIMPTVHQIEGDIQPHLVAHRKALVIVEPKDGNIAPGEVLSVSVKNANGEPVYQTTLQTPANQPAPVGQMDVPPIVVPEHYAHHVNHNHHLIAGEQGQEALKALLIEHRTLQVETADGNWAKEFVLVDDPQLDGAMITFTSQAGFNSSIRYTQGVESVSTGDSVTFNNLAGLWYAQADHDFSKLAYSKNAYTAILPAEVVEPGFSLTFDTGARQGILETIEVGAPTQLILNTIDVGLLTPPRNAFEFITNEKLHRDYFQSLQISKLVVNPYQSVHVQEIMLPDGRLLIDLDPGHADTYGSDSHYRITRELFSAGINSANYGVNSADVMSGSVWNIAAPYHAAQVTVNSAVGNYSHGLIKHGMLGSYAGVASVIESVGNEFSHEVGHEFGAFSHYLGGFEGSVHNRSTQVNATWGWDVFTNAFIPNLSKGRTQQQTCYDGQCADTLAGHSFGWGTMAGGAPMYPQHNGYTLHTPYELELFQRTLEDKANFDASSATGFSKWNKESKTMAPWLNEASDDLAFRVVTISGNDPLNQFGPDSQAFHALFAETDAVRLKTGNGDWAGHFYLPDDPAFEGKIAVFESQAGYNSTIHFSGQSLTLTYGNKHALRFNAGQWLEVDKDIIDGKAARVPAKQGVPVTTLVGYYDPQNTLPTYLYPALYGAYGAVYADNFSPSSCQLTVLTREGGSQTFNLHNHRLRAGLMNRFHVNVETALAPYRAELFCQGELLGSINIDPPTQTLKANIITTERGKAPTLTGIADVSLKQGEPFDPRAGVSAHDEEDGDISAAIVVEGSVNTDMPGTYTLTYRVTDSEGQTVTAIRTVTVEANADCITHWQRKDVYVAGDKVTHNGALWLAGWWTKGEEPGTTGEWGVWQQTHDNSCDLPETEEPETVPPAPQEYPDYEPGVNYQAGDIVKTHNNKLYQCKPWPNASWCSNPAYEPGRSPYWQDAWTRL